VEPRPKYMSPLRPYCASSTGLTYTGGVASSISSEGLRTVLRRATYRHVVIHGYDCTSAVSYDWVGNGGVAHASGVGPWLEQFGEGLPWRGAISLVAHMSEKAKRKTEFRWCAISEGRHYRSCDTEERASVLCRPACAPRERDLNPCYCLERDS